MEHEAYETGIETGGDGRQAGRLAATVIGALALIAAPFLKWTAARDGDELTLRALVRTDFGAQPDFIKTVGALSILIGLLALIGIADRTGWLTRLAGVAALVVSVTFAIESYRSAGGGFGSPHGTHAGSGLELVGALVLLIGGLLGSRVVRVAAVAEPEPIEKLLEEPVERPADSSSERGAV
jgi:hypothetical protein